MFPNSPNIRITLLNVATNLDGIGNKSLSLLSSKEVIGMMFSITSKEHYESARQDIRIDLAVKIISFLYDNSLYAEILDVIYKIEKTYLNGQFLELYLYKTSIKSGDIIGYS
jgi:hypothetical protein